MKLGVIATTLGGALIGDPDHDVVRIAPLVTATSDTLTFVLSKTALPSIRNRGIVAVITFKELPDIPNQIIVKNTRKALAQTISLFYPIQVDHYISPHAIIDTTATVDHPAHIRDGVSIGANVRIGTRCVIHPNVTIYPNCVIGNDVIIHAGTVIGSDGFGYYSDGGKWGKIPHVGRVIIGDNVELGANVTVDRGVLEDTVIGTGTKIDNLCHIAHNTQIGTDCAFAGQSGTVGHSVIGNRVQIGGQAGINTVKIGDDSIVAARSGVTHDVPEKSMVSGFPAGNHFQELKKDAWIRHQFRKRKDLKC
ncbi:UDP-3-O-(3-hydroxymyristoyl)glucosamine N-acyltransferase [bacterium]|nr:UDP-3-O-(3-hydroxymyristoyl)glucosamine N-acyltransferase [bacterium]